MVAPAGVEWQILDKTSQQQMAGWQDTVAEYRQRIDKVRRRDLELRLTDRHGRPHARRQVRVVQTNSGFLWGFGGWGLLNALRDGSYATLATERHYRGLASLFNAVNEAIWEPVFADTAKRHWPHLAKIERIADDVEKVLRWAREEDPDAAYLILQEPPQPDPQTVADRRDAAHRCRWPGQAAGLLRRLPGPAGAQDQPRPGTGRRFPVAASLSG